MKIREVKRIVNGYPTTDGAGVNLVRVLGQDHLQEIDPFLMLDHFGSDNPEKYMAGFPMHPHRGIETITYLLEGSVTHRDSLGNSGTIHDGQLQWMTAGSGILHEEMPEKSVTLSGLQLWLNLPTEYKMTTPRYFPITNDLIKEFPIDGGRILLIAGEFQGVKATEGRFVNIQMIDIQLEAEKSLEIPTPYNLNNFIYMLEGSGQFGLNKESVKKHSAAIFAEGDVVTVQAGKKGLRMLFLAGEPLHEPIAWAGPVVMNTREELYQAFAEIDNGTFVK